MPNRSTPHVAASGISLTRQALGNERPCAELLRMALGFFQENAAGDHHATVCTGEVHLKARTFAFVILLTNVGGPGQAVRLAGVDPASALELDDVRSHFGPTSLQQALLFLLHTTVIHQLAVVLISK